MGQDLAGSHLPDTESINHREVHFTVHLFTIISLIVNMLRIRGGQRPTEGVRGSSPGWPLGAAAAAAGENRFKSNRPSRPGVIRTRKKPGNRLAFRVWMTGLEPATSWSLTRCATNCATSRGPSFKGTANIGILFRKNKRRATYFSAGQRTGPRAAAAQASGLGAVRASWRAFRADLRAEAARRRRTGPLTTAKVPRSSFSSSGVKLG